MSKSLYSNISQIGSNAYDPINNPLTYCLNTTLDQRFYHGSSSDALGPYSTNCKRYLSEYCAEGWDAFCEIASTDKNKSFPSITSSLPSKETAAIFARGLTAGEGLIRDTASRKYLVQMINCEKKI